MRFGFYLEHKNKWDKFGLNKNSVSPPIVIFFMLLVSVHLWEKPQRHPAFSIIKATSFFLLLSLVLPSFLNWWFLVSLNVIIKFYFTQISTKFQAFSLSPLNLVPPNTLKDLCHHFGSSYSNYTRSLDVFSYFSTI